MCIHTGAGDYVATRGWWKKPKKPKVRKPEKGSVHTYFISSGDEEEPEPPIAGSSSGASVCSGAACS